MTTRTHVCQGFMLWEMSVAKLCSPQLPLQQAGACLTGSLMERKISNLTTVIFPLSSSPTLPLAPWVSVKMKP